MFAGVTAYVITEVSELLIRRPFQTSTYDTGLLDATLKKESIYGTTRAHNIFYVYDCCKYVGLHASTSVDIAHGNQSSRQKGVFRIIQR